MRILRRLLPALLFAAALRAETIDRIAATLDGQAITTSQILEDLRVAAFLNGEKPEFGAAARRRMADRLIEQLLVLREMELTRYPGPSAAEIAEPLRQVRARLPDEAQFQRELAAYKLTGQQLDNALRRQVTLLRFIDLRFRPEVQVQESEVMQYYETVFLPEIRKKGIAPDPTYDDVRIECEEALTARLVDKRVDRWLAEARARARIDYDEDAFR
jgi:hypothetical protein